MLAGAVVIYLHASVEHQLARTARDRNRPLLQAANPRQVLANLLAIRDPLYREVTTLIIETDTRPPRMVVQEIMQFLSTYKGR